MSKRMTRKETIQECKKLWRDIKKSGKSKADFICDTLQGEIWVNKRYRFNCPLCEHYRNDYGKHPCRNCPLVKQYSSLVSLPFYSSKECICYDLGFNEELVSSKEWFDFIENLKEE